MKFYIKKILVKSIAMNVVKYVTREPLSARYVYVARCNDQLIGHLLIDSICNFVRSLGNFLKYFFFVVI